MPLALLAALDVDQITDLIGLPLAMVLIGLLLAIDLVRIDPDGSPLPAFLARRRTLVVASAITAVAFFAVVIARVSWLAA